MRPRELLFSDDLRAAREKELARRVAEYGTIRNKGLAGKKHPHTKIPFDEDGFPDFSSVTKKEVKIKYTGDRGTDIAAANEAARYEETPNGYTWHHHQDGVTMQLVPKDVHSKTAHTGGFALWPF